MPEGTVESEIDACSVAVHFEEERKEGMIDHS